MEKVKKNIPTLRFPQFEGEWEKKKLKKVATFFSGGTPLSTKKSYYNGHIPFIKSGEIKYDTTAQYLSDEGLKNSSSKMVKKGDLLIALYGTTSGEVAISQINGAINQAILCIRGKFDNIYCYNFFLKHKDKIISTYLQGGQGNLSAEIIKSITIPFPSLQEQKKIADFLTITDKRIELLTKKKQLCQQYKKVMMQKLFSQELRFKDENGKEFSKWEVKSLGDLTKYYDGTHQTPKYVKEGVPFYSVESITGNNFSDTKYISEEVFEIESKRVILEKKDILMTRIGDIGTVKYIDWDVRASFYVSIILIKQSDNINSLYLYQFIKSSFFQKELWKRTIHVAFPRKINLGEIGNCRVKCPSFSEQKKIANFLTALDKKIELVEKEIHLSEQFKKYLLQNLFV